MDSPWPLCKPPEEGCRHTERGVQSRFVVGQEPAWPLQWRFGGVGVAGCVVPPAAGMENVDALGVAELGGRVNTEGRDRTEHHVRMPPRPVGGPTEGTVIDDRVGAADEPVQGLDSTGGTEIQHDGLFVGVEVCEQPTAIATVGHDGGHRPGRAAALRRLDLDDLGAEVGQQLSAVLPRDRPGQLNDTDASQRRHASSPKAVRASRVPSGSGATPAGSSSRCP